MMGRTLMFVLVLNALHGQKTLNSLSGNFEVLVPVFQKESQITPVPAKFIKGLLLIEGKVEGRRGYFILDTGAPGIVVNRPVDNLGKELTAHSLRTPISIGTTVLKSVDLGVCQLQNIETYAIDLSHLERFSGEVILGLLGYEHLKDHLTYINYKEKTIYWLGNQNGTIHHDSNTAFSCSFELWEHLPVISLRSGDKVLRFVLDTGSSVNLISTEAANRLKSDRHLADNDLATILEGLEQASETLSAMIIPNLQMGNISKTDSVFHIADLGPASSFLGNSIDGIIGYQFLRKHQVIINYRSQKMTILD